MRGLGLLGWLGLLLGRRRRSESGRSACAAAVGLVLVGCHDDAATVTDTSDTTESDTSEGDPSEGDTDSGIRGWPERWHGDYYNDPGVLGRPVTSTFGVFINLGYEADLVTVELFFCRDEEPERWSYRPRALEPGLMRLEPQQEGDELLWNNTRVDEVLLHAGASCADLEVELIGFGGMAEPYVLSFQRGWICIVDFCDEPGESYIIDLCPDVPTTCEDTTGAAAP